MQVFTYSGAVVELGSRRGIAKLRVELWDLDHVCHDLVDAAFTDASGAFRVALDASRVDELFLGRPAVAYFKVFHDATLVADTHAHLSWSIREGDGSGRVEIPKSMGAVGKDQPAPWIVRGRVLNARTGPIPGATVRAVHKALRAETELGRATADAQGTYQISYDAGVLLRLGKQRADLAVTVLDGSGTQPGQAPVLFQAPATAEVDVLVGGAAYVGPAEADILQEAVARAAEGVRPSALSAADQEFLASAEVLDPVALQTLVAADQLAGETASATAPLYAVGRAGIALTVQGIFRASPGTVRSALDAAVAANRLAIPAGKTLDDLHGLVNAAAVRAALVKSVDGLVATLGGVLSTVVPTAAAQEALLTSYLNRTSTADFWASVGQGAAPPATGTGSTSPAGSVATFSSGSTTGSLRLALDVAALSGMHLPLIQALIAGKVAGPLSTLRDLARLDVSDWTALLNTSYAGKPIGAPASVAGATPAERIASYAAQLTTTLATAFPTAALAGRLVKANRPADADIRAFLADNPDFDFAGARVAAYLAKNPKALASAREPEAAAAALRVMERVFKLTSVPEELDLLHQGGIDSARAVETMGRTAFLEKFGDRLGPSADRILANACYVTSAVQELQARYDGRFNALEVRALPRRALHKSPIVGPRPTPVASQVGPILWEPQPVYVPPEMADWEQLFGKLDLCQCDECESVYGPSAYLVDLLQFLDTLPSSVPKPGAAKQFYTARDLLIGPNDATTGFQIAGRRPDIGHIALDCVNDNTPVPYVDLLNEILECKVFSVATSTGVTFPSPAQTTGEPGDLAVNRQILQGESKTYQAAYATVALATYPWSLPFDRAAEEARTHLSLLDVPPARLMRVLSVTPATASELSYEIAAVSLGLCPLDRALVTGVSPSGTPVDPASYWNLQGTAAWEHQLLVAETFLTASGLAYADLMELLDTTLLVPFLATTGTPPTLAVKDPAGSDCDLSNLVITGLDATKLPALWPLVHQFLRLRSKVGLSITELDKLVAAFTPASNAASISDAMLQRVAVIADLRAQLGTPLLELVSWWSDVDHRPSPLTQQPRLFDQTFLNPALSNNPPAADDDDADFILVRDGQAPSVGKPNLIDHATRLAAACQISVADVALLVDNDASMAVLQLPRPIAPPPPPQPPPAPPPPPAAPVPFTLDNVSAVFRYASLARALRLSIADLLQLTAMASASPFNAADLTQAALFVQEAKRVQGSKFSVPEIVYLLRNLVDPAGASSLAYDGAQLFVAGLVPGLSKILSDTKFDAVAPQPPLPTGALVADDPAGATARKLLGKNLAPGDVEAVLAAAVGGDLPAGTTSTPAQILTSGLSFLDASVAAQLVTNLSAHAPAAQSYGFLTAALLLDQRRSDSTALIVRSLATALRLDGPMVTQLATALVRSSQSGSTVSGIADFLPPMTPAVSAPLAPGDLPFAVPTYLRLQKAAMLAQKLGIAVEELGASTDFLDVNTLPITSGGVPAAVAPSQDLFRQWERLADTFAIKSRLQAGPKALFQLINAAKAASSWDTFAAQSLSPVTGWALADIQDIKAACGFTFPDDFTTETGYLALANAFDVLGQLGVSASRALVWAKAFSVPMGQAFLSTPFAAVTAADIKKAVKAKYDAPGWLVAEKPVSDQLRDKQRASMVSWLLFNTFNPPSSRVPVYQTDSDLHADLLVDVDMSPSVQASRVSLAIGSTQLFVQRCLLSLESVTLTPEQIEQWKWMKQYRVWEANREIFLYPENWMVPALRDDKTPLYTALETTLSKNAVTSDIVEDGLRTYLEGLQEVARLEIAAIYRQAAADSSGDAIYHVFGRTRATPAVYYYRRWTGQRNWTPWEKLSVNIDGNTVLPMTMNGRLFLFWPIIAAKSDPVPLTVPAKTGAAPAQHLEIQIAWTERKHDAWTGKQLAQGVITIASTDVGKMQQSFDTADDMIRGALFFTTDTSASPPVVRCGTYEGGQLMYRGEATWDPCTGSASCTTYPAPQTAQEANAQTLQADLPSSMQIRDNQPWFPPPLPPPAPQSPLALTIDHSTVPLSGSSAQTQKSLFTVLTQVPSSFELVFSRQWPPFDVKYSFFMQDGQATFLIEPRDPPLYEQLALTLLGESYSKTYRFHPHYQPYVCDFLETLNTHGLAGTQGWSSQVSDLQQKSDALMGPALQYRPSTAVEKPYPAADVDFTFTGAYSPYNWELFFHVPLLIATSLGKNQQFEDAHAWFHAIFDPNLAGQAGTTQSLKSHIWKVRPFAENTDLSDLAADIAKTFPETLEGQLLEGLLSGGQDDPGLTWDFNAQILEWQRDPFNPYLIGRMRPLAFQKMVVMRYLDNLIAWGDYLFRQETIEAINEATQLYILAAEVLGPRPAIIPAPGKPAPLTYWQLLASKLDTFSDAMVDLEGVVVVPEATKPCPVGQQPPAFQGLYFCVPPNSQLLAYWDTIEDRLFKIRHSMNIAGVFRQLPLYAPPIDPALLVAAKAAGVDIDTVLEDVSGPVPVYRFTALLPKAQEVAAGVSQFGASLLAALEKSDAEALAQLRAGQELGLLQLITDVKQRQVDEAQANVDALTAALAVVAAKQAYYHSREYMNAPETQALLMSGTAMIMQAAGQAATAAGATVQATVPTFYFGNVGPLPTSLTAYGGENGGTGGVSQGQALSMTATILHEDAALIATQGGYQRRMDDWQFQASLADTEHEQVSAQLIAAKIRLDIANKELANHEQQVENAQAISDFLQGKFTNQDLFDWMTSQLSAVYFRAYQMAYQVAKRTERAYQIELAAPKASFIDPGNWNNLRQGLLAGEKLQFDLRRMELSYLDENKREFEITKSISLAQSFPESLLELALTGTTTLSLPENLFDADYPGHYLRRIKAVSLTLPGIAGPYTSVNCTLTQTSSSIRMDTLGQGSSLVQSYVGIQKVATSAGTTDAGLFEVNFHDERYLPFEGSGVVSTWRIDLPATTNAFDITTIEDVVMQLRYTARDGGADFQSTVSAAMAGGKSKPENMPARLVRASIEQPGAWDAFINPSAGTASAALSLDLARFPSVPGGGTLTVRNIEAVAQGMNGMPFSLALTVGVPGTTTTYRLTTPDSKSVAFSASKLSNPSDTSVPPTPIPFTPVSRPDPLNGPWLWTFTAAPSADLTGLAELWVRVTYTQGV